MTVQLKRVYEAPATQDGMRILVDRLWPRGMAKARAAVDLWMKEVAPSTELRKWYSHDPDKWPEFRKRYRAELKANPGLAQLKELAAKKKKVTLLFASREERMNEAAVLKEILDKPAAK